MGRLIPSDLRRGLLALLLLVGGVARPADAQDVTEVTLKSAFLFNFARFTEWPADLLSAEAPVSACVVGDRAVGDALTRAVQGRQVSGRTITVAIVEPDSPLPPCHMLYISGVAGPRVLEIVSALRDTPVLTVSDADTFASIGGIVQVFVENGKMRFRINPRSAKRARLQLSSRLLALADLVEDEASRPGIAAPLGHLLISVRPSRVLASSLSGLNWARRVTAWRRD